MLLYSDPNFSEYNDTFYRNYRDPKELLNALNAEIEINDEMREIIDIDERKIEGLTYGVYISNAINEKNLVEIGSKFAFKPDKATAEFFRKLADNLAYWKPQVAKIILEQILKGVFVVIGSPGLSIGVSTLGLATDLTLIGIGINKLNDLLYERGFWHYFQSRNLGHDHSTAWEAAKITGAGAITNKNERQTEEYFKSLWDTYGENISDDGLKEDFKAEQRKKLKALLLYALGAQAHPVISSPLKITPPPYQEGDEIKAEFTITNKGKRPIFLKTVTVGGRYGSKDEVIDFTKRHNIELDIDESYKYHGTLTLAKAGNYHFFCAYQTADGKWNPSVDLGRGLTDEDRTEAITAKVKEEEPPKKQITKVSKMVGKLSTYQDEKQNLMFLIVPLVMYEGGNYRSVYVESWKEYSEKIRQDLENIKKLWLYHEGNLIGIFEVSGFEENAGSYQEGVLTGKVRWEPKITTDIHNVVALSRPIPQPFWSKELNSEQISSLNQILNETLMRASTLLTEELKQHGIHYEDSQRTIGTAPKGRSTIIFDLEQDDQPEVYASVHWKGEPCAEMYASILATWKDNNWIVLRRSTSIAECPGIGETAGERRFEIEAVVDIDGDGVAELIMSEGAWENYEYILYQVHKGRLIRILDIGNYGL